MGYNDNNATSIFVIVAVLIERIFYGKYSNKH